MVVDHICGNYGTELLQEFFNPLSHPTMMFRRRSIEQLVGYDEKYRTSQDYHLCSGLLV